MKKYPDIILEKMRQRERRIDEEWRRLKGPHECVQELQSFLYPFAFYHVVYFCPSSLHSHRRNKGVVLGVVTSPPIEFFKKIFS